MNVATGTMNFIQLLLILAIITASSPFFASLQVLVLAESNEASKIFLEENAKKEGVIVLESGWQYKVLRSGPTDGPRPDHMTECVCHYEGKLIDGTVFDSSYERGEPVTFTPAQVVQGWTEALKMMTEGDMWELYIPSELGYGDNGSGDKIKPGDALIFTLELVKIKQECDISTLKGCSASDKVVIVKAKKAFGDDPDYIAEGIHELHEKKGAVTIGKHQDAIKRRIELLTNLFFAAGGDRDDLPGEWYLR